MEIIKEEAFRKQIKTGLRGGYLFYGDEDYLKAFSVRAARDAICPDPTFALFNDMRIHVIDYSAGALLDALMPLPMMSEQKLVCVDGLCIKSLRPDEINALCDVLARLDEYDYNVLIISVPAGQIEVESSYKKLSETFRRLSEYLTPVHFEAISPAKLVSWVGKHFAHGGVKASPDVCAYLIDYSGKSMYTLSNETEKLSYYVISHGRDTVTRHDIEQVCTSEISADAFALANAILDGKNHVAMDVLSVMKFRKTEPRFILSEISKVFYDLISIKALADQGLPPMEIAAILKINEYKVKLYCQKSKDRSMQQLKRAADICAETDKSIKTFLLQGYMPIERLICSL